jgi:phage shock protein A
MPDDDAYDFFRQQLAQLTRRVERLEGKIEQLHAGNVTPALRFASWRAFDDLKDRVTRLERPTKPESR